MKKSVVALALAALGLVAHNAQATLIRETGVYREVGDAGYSLATAQKLPSGTTSIIGTLTGVDVYRFDWAGGNFTASTSTNFDPMLFLYDLAGSVLAFNDDSGWSLEASLSLSLGAGSYLLAISPFGYNYNGPLSGFANAGIVQGGAAYRINLGTATAAAPAAAVSAVPEPMSLALVGLGLVGLFAVRRKQA
ncbi:MAG: DVUA0089 family protein [Rhodocyclaceae bacterium]